MHWISSILFAHDIDKTLQENIKLPVIFGSLGFQLRHPFLTLLKDSSSVLAYKPPFGINHVRP
jgi:hypothetical protein